MPAVYVKRAFDESDTIGKSSTVNLKWYVFNAADRVSARAALIAEIPQIEDGLLLNSVSAGSLTPECWEFSTVYGFEGTPTEGEVRLTLEGEEGRETITKSRREVASGAVTGRTAPPSNRVIGVQSDGTVRGVEIPISKGLLRAEVYRQADLYTAAYARQLLDLENTVNANDWHSFPAGSLRFRKPFYEKNQKLAQDGTAMQRLILEFEYEKNATNIPLGDMTVPSKKGHHFLDYRSEKSVATVGGKKIIVNRIVYWWIHEVYEEADYATLFGF